MLLRNCASFISLLFCTQLLVSCSSKTLDEDSRPTLDIYPMASNDVLVVEKNSSSGEDNQVNSYENDTYLTDTNRTDYFAIDVGPKHGSVSEITDGVFEYIPEKSIHGTDSFSYKLTDKNGKTSSAVVNITINAYLPTAQDFENIDPNFPSFTSIDDTTPDGKKWVKLESMSDEFDVWNENKWFKSTWNYDVPVYMSTSSENSWVEKPDGKLWIRATLNERNPDGRWFQTARIHSKAKVKYPMYTEAKIKTAHISAYNTFWLNNGDIKNRDEIDIIENNSNPACMNCKADNYKVQMNSQYFHADSNASPQTIRNYGNFLRTDLSDANPLKNKGWNEDYHTYGVWWKDAKHIQFYLDGEPAGSVVVGEDRSGETYENREFTKELEIIFDLWTNKADYLGGLPEKVDLYNIHANTMKIDWVRTWTLEDE